MSTTTDGNTPQGNQAAFFGTKVSIPGIDVNSAGDNQLILKDDYSSRIYYNDNGVPTVLLGLRPNTTPSQRGLYVSQDGVDVTTASDSQLIFNTNQNIYKIVDTGTTAIPSYSFSTGKIAWQTITTPHNLNFIPIANVYAQVTYNTWPNGAGGGATQISAYVPLPYDGIVPPGENSGNVGNSYYIDYAIDATNLYITYYYTTNSSTSFNYPYTPIKYELLQNTIN